MHSYSITAIAAAILLSACTDHTTAPPAPPKPVKIEVTDDATMRRTDSFVGTVRARQRTELGFEAAGRLIAVKVDVGDHVKAGQVLAQLDVAPARWRLDKAEADLKAAAATVAERQNWLRQQETLARDGIIAPAALQTAQASYQQASSQHAAAEAAVAGARRDLSLTHITAPFDADVVARLAQPFTDIAAGQPILQLESGRALEVVAQLPDEMAARLTPGSEALGRIGEHKLQLKLERLSARNDNGSLAQAVFQVSQAPAGVRSGSVVSLELPRKAAQTITVPASAIISGTDNQHPSVFVVADGKLQKRPVKIMGQLLPNGRVNVIEGLRSSEKVVVAGSAFLNEGQSVIVHQASTLLQGEAP